MGNFVYSIFLIFLLTFGFCTSIFPQALYDKKDAPKEFSISDFTTYKNQYFAPDKYGFGGKTLERPCVDAHGNVSSEPIKLEKESTKMARYTNCNLEIETAGYSNENCRQYESCSQSIFGVNSMKNIGKTELFQTKILPIFSRITAEQYSNKMIAKNLNEIEKNKVLRKFAEKSGIKISSQNECELKNIKHECSSNEIDKSFEGISKSCNSTSNYRCYNLEENEYTSINTKNKNELKSEIYLDRIAENIAIESISSEDKKGNTYQEIIEFINSQSHVKNLKTKTIAIKNLFSKLEKENKLDPYLLKLSESTIDFESMVKSISTSKLKDTAMLLKTFKQIRAENLKKMFSGESCNSMPSLQKICEDKFNITTFNKDSVTPLKAQDVAEIFNGENFVQAFDAIKKYEFDFLGSKSEYAALMKGYRCYMLVYDFRPKPGEFQCRIDDNPPIPTASNFYISPERISTINAMAILSDDNRPDKEKVAEKADRVIEDTSVKSGVVEDKTKQNNSTVAVKEEVKNADTIDLNKVMSDSLNGSNIDTQTSVLAKANTTYFNPITTTVDENKLEKKEDKKENNEITKNTISELDEKINELNKKLLKTEDSIKNASAKTSTTEDTIKPNDSSDAVKLLEGQVKSLKSELTKLKAEEVLKKDPISTSISTVSKPQAESNYSKVSNSNIGNDRSESSSIANPINDNNQDVNRRPASVSNSSVITSGNSNVSSSNNFSSSNSKVTGLVLTKVDGLSSEAVTETITQKINESNGTAFLIEEGGFVKEIIPVLKNGKIVLDEKGKPIFEKIVKGKVSEIKAKEAKRAAASVQDTASLRKAEDLKNKIEEDRLKYKKLKEITSESIK